jgi:hypothetical protein
MKTDSGTDEGRRVWWMMLCAVRKRWVCAFCRAVEPFEIWMTLFDWSSSDGGWAEAPTHTWFCRQNTPRAEPRGWRCHYGLFRGRDNPHADRSTRTEDMTRWLEVEDGLMVPHASDRRGEARPSLAPHHQLRKRLGHYHMIGGGVTPHHAKG